MYKKRTEYTKDEFFKKALNTHGMWESLKPEPIYEFKDWDDYRRKCYFTWKADKEFMIKNNWFDEFKERYIKDPL